MVALVGTTILRFAPLPGNINFTADNRLDSLFESQVMKLNGSEEIAMSR